MSNRLQKTEQKRLSKHCFLNTCNLVHVKRTGDVNISSVCVLGIISGIVPSLGIDI